MGVDVVGFRWCSLQTREGEAGFVRLLKLRALRDEIDALVPLEDRADISVEAPLGDNVESMTYSELAAELDDFAGGIDTCDTCSIGGGVRVGCYGFLSYPLDAVFEKLLFSYASASFTDAGTLVGRLYVELLENLPRAGTPWHVQRGPEGPISRLSEPLIVEDDAFLDSAQLLHLLSISTDDRVAVIELTTFWLGLLKYAGEHLDEPSRTFGELWESRNVLIGLLEYASEGLDVRLVMDG